MDNLNTIILLIGCASLFGATYFLCLSVQIRNEAKEQVELGLQIHEDTADIQENIARLQMVRPTCPAVAVSDWNNVIANLESMQDFERLALLHEAIKGKSNEDFVPPPQGFWTFYDDKGHIMIQLI